MAKPRRRTTRRRGPRSPQAAVASFNPDYTYIKQDLKRIATLATGFIVTLVVLSFFIK